MAGRDILVDGIAGIFLQPVGHQSSPVALIVAGSGPTDRNGNSPVGLRTDAYRLLAEALAERGIASLRYDKRGVAGSKAAAPSEHELSIETFVSDAVTLADWLHRQATTASIHLVGHSEGALIGCLAAARVQVASVTLLCGPGEPFGKVLRRQLISGPLPPEMRPKINAILDAFDAGLPVPEVPTGLVGLFRPSVQPYLLSLWQIDPAMALASVKVPVLLIGGGADIQVREQDFELLTTAHPHAKSHWFDDMTHVLKAREQHSIQKIYGDPSLPLMPGLAEQISTHILSA